MCLTPHVEKLYIRTIVSAIAHSATLRLYEKREDIYSVEMIMSAFIIFSGEMPGLFHIHHAMIINIMKAPTLR